jgi:hypothetical protein
MKNDEAEKKKTIKKVEKKRGKKTQWKMMK